MSNNISDDMSVNKIENVLPIDTPATNTLTISKPIHRFIYDEQQIRRFAELIGTDNSTHHLHVIGRPKYNSSVKFKTHYMSPKTIRNLSSEEFAEKIRSFEVPVGYYRDSNKVICPVDSLVIYCTTNPRCNKKAAKKLLHELVDAFAGDSINVIDNLNNRLNSCIMSSKGETKLITMDIDSKIDLPEVLEYLDKCNIVPVANIETHGGYHLMLKPEKNIENVFKKFSSKHTMGDINCPVPGTLQGGFPVRFV